MTFREYNGTAYRQAGDPESPWLVSFVAPAEEVLTWAGIPRRAKAGLIGFQRTDDATRIDRARDYFRQGPNQSPTALIVGLNPSPTVGLYEIEFDPAQDPDAPIRRCVLRILADPENLSTETVVNVLKGRIAARLRADAESAEDTSEITDLTPEVEFTNPEDEADAELDDEFGASDEIELGDSMLAEFMARLDDRAWVEENIADLRDLAKPATIIDGQHRVLGAALCARGIPFAVVGLVDCTWQEQVFQFTVVNYTAKGIPDQFITANAALSLTGAELDDLQIRLTQAGVKVIEYELMRVVNFDARSPFFDLVNLTEKPSPGRIGYKTMVRVGKAWHDAKDPALQLVIRNMYPEIKGRSPQARRERLQRWKSDDWGDLFIAFWQTVRDRYGTVPSHRAGLTLWEVGSQLMIAVVLQQLQLAFFSNLRAQDEDFFEVEATDNEAAKVLMEAKLRRRAEKLLDSIPSEFFATEWGTKSLSTGAGRRDLESAFTQLIDSKGRYQFLRSSLVTNSSE